MPSDSEYQRLKDSILALGPVLPGTIRKVFLRCGKKNCHCQSKDKKQWHGPYSFWDRKEEKGLSSRSIPSKQVKLFQDWINKRRELERIVRQMLNHGVAMAEELKSSKKLLAPLAKSKSLKMGTKISAILLVLCGTLVAGSMAQAADVQVQLDSSSNPGFSVSNSSGVGVDRIDSNGNVGIGTTTAVTLLYVSPQGILPTFATPADAYIQNNLEVDGTIYSTNVQATGGYTQSGNSLNIFTGNLGIGTSSPNSELSVLGGASFGSYATIAAPAGGIITSGNIGIGSSAPGRALDVQGGIRTTAFTMSGNTPISGYVLTAADSSGDTTWSTPGLVGGWTVSGTNVYETNMGNVGIGTTTVNQGALVVTNGNVGIGTWTTAGGNLIVNGGGNVGINSAWPGEALDVQGGIRSTAFTMSGQTPISGYVLTASDSSGDTTWSSPGTVGGWTVSGNNVYETSNGNVGIGTSSVNEGALVVTNGNVGIGTWAPTAPLAVGANAFTVNSTGAITATTGIITSGAYTQSGVGANTLSGQTAFTASGISASFASNVGIGSTAPGQALDVNGTIRTSNFTMSGQTPISGYVLTASDSSGDTTWSSPGTVGGWTVSGNNVYETSSGNVGIGTSTVNQGSLVVTNGNVGIGTWAPTAPLAVGANAFTVNSTGAITATTGIITSGAYTQSGVGANTLSGQTAFTASGISASFASNVGIGSTAPGQALDVNGTIRTSNFTMSGQTPISGYVLTASDSSGDTTWSSPGTVGGWTVSGNNVYETSSGNVGIGTSTVNQGSLVVTNGNVGIGTWAPTAPLAVGANAFTVNSTGAITATTGITTSGAYTQSGVGANTLSGTTTFSAAGTSASFVGNVGIGSTAPGQALDVNGTIRTSNFTMSGQTPISGYVLTASDSSGDTTWSSPGTVGGWTVSGNNVYETSSGNVGIGTSALQTALAVTNGNVGIGTWTAANPLSVAGGAAIGSTVYTNSAAPANGLIVSGNVGIGTWIPNASLAVGANAFTVNNAGAITATTGITTTGAYTQSGAGANTLSGTTTFSAAGTSALFTGNVGIGSTAPGQALDVNGTIRTSNFTMSGQTPISGYVLMSNDSNGDATWSSLAVISGWTVVGNNVYQTNLGNVGIGTTTVTQGALLVTNGNVGIGTWAPNSIFAVGANAFTVNNIGAITATTGITTSGAYTQSGGGVNTLSGKTTFSAVGISASFAGNVGIGSVNPGQALDVQGTVRTTGFTMSGQTPISGYVLTASDSSGDTTWSSPGDVGGWTVSGNNVYETSSGNVGIGTTSVTQGALLVTNGNVGIGTWAPTAPLAVGANAFTVNSTGMITAVTGITTSGAYTQSGNGINAFTGNIGEGTTTPQGSLIVTNGNVGIGTWAPTAPLTVGANAFTVNSTGAITAVTGITTSGAYTQSGGGVNTLSGKTTFSAAGISASFAGNVGIGSVNPGQILDVQGTVRTTGFTMSGQTPISGYVLTASDSSGDTTWSSPGDVSGWTISGNNVYETSSGNVGIGTSSVTQGSLLVTNGNVGIGTWTPNSIFAVGANAFTVNSTGMITAVTGITTSGAYTQSGNGINAFTGNIGEGTTTPQGSLIVTNGNVGIGTWAPTAPLTVGANAFTVNSTGAITAVTGITTSGAYTQSGGGVNTLSGKTTFSAAGISASFVGNVGIGSVNPGQALDVQGTVRTTGFTMSGQTPISGYVLTASDSSGDTTWSSPGDVGGWTVSGNNVYETSSGNVGIGTTTLNQGALVVTNGNVGIGTWAPTAPLTVGANAFTVNSTGAITAVTGITTSGAYTQSGGGANTLSGTTTFNAAGISASFAGNVGIGSVNPGQRLDVQGTVRTTGFTMSGQTPISGYVLTASDSSGDTTWSSPGDVGGWTVSGNNVYETSSGNVGIGTSTVNQGSLLVTNGNVGIGTWTPNSIFAVGANAFTVNNLGTITAVTGITTSGAYTQSGGGVNTLSGKTTFSAAGISASFVGNVGIGSVNPGQALDVQGTVRTTGFTMSGQTPISGYVLTASDSSGDTTWSSPGTVGGWTVSGNNVYETSSGNVGIGTSTVNQGSLLVTNGNVGIGTWTPNSLFAVGSNAFTVNNTGAITAVTGITTSGAYTQSGNGINAFTGNIGEGTTTPQGSLVVTNGNVGIGTWAPQDLFQIGKYVSSVSGFMVDSNGNVGIGTIITSKAAMSIMNGNVGIGTYIPPVLFAAGPGTPIHATAVDDSYFGHDVEVEGILYATTVIGAESLSGDLDLGGFYLTSKTGLGNGTVSISGGTGTDQTDLAIATNHFVGIGTSTPASRLTVNGGESIGTALSYLTNLAPANGLMVQGNVGIGSQSPGQALDVNGTIRTSNFTMSGQTPISGYVLTASDSSGDTTWSSPGTVGGWTVSGNNVYETSSGNVGIGTSTVNQGSLLVTNGNVGIGTWTPNSIFAVGANAFTVNSTGAITAVTGITTSGAYTQNGNGINSFTGNIGEGTTTPQGSLVVTNGNVGIGTWAPTAPLTVGANAFTVNNVGVITAVTGITTSGAYTQSGGGVNTLSGKTTFSAVGISASFVGNVGIGSVNPGQALDVQGTVRTTGFTMSGQTPISGYVLTASDSSGDTTWSSPGTVGGWTVSGNNVYETSSGNVGIGTSTVNQGSLLVTNGNVGIGTWTPNSLFAVGANAFTVNNTGAITAVTGITTSGAYTQSGNGINAFTGNIGEGTTTPQGSLVVTNGNVGIGTWAPTAPLTVGANAFTVNNVGVITAVTGITTSGAYTQSGGGVNTLSGKTTFSAVGISASFVGNVGIGSVNPGQALDVQGTVRTTGFTMSGQTPISGYVLTASDSSGDTTWSSPGTVGGWTVSGNNVYETSSGNVGIGTSTVNQGSLLVTNGNVGIGTWTPTSLFAVGANAFTINNAGVITAVTGITTSGAYTQSGGGANTLSGTTTFSAAGISASFTGNVGIGSVNPGQRLDVQGTVRTTGFTMSGQTPISGYVLTASDSSGDTTWSSPGTVGGWTVSGNNVYETSSGNVGIGTSTVNQGSLLVTNGNVGIGTWTPNSLFAVGSNAFTVNNTGAITAVTGITTSGAYTQNGNGINSFTGNIGEGTTTPQGSLVVTNGNVGIGTWAPTAPLTVGANAFTVNNVGVITAVTGITTSGAYTQSGGGANTLSGKTTFSAVGISASFVGNVGIGSVNPGQALDVQGTVRTTGFTMSGQTPISGYVLTASDSSGDTTWSSPGTVGGWTVSGNNVYETSSGNVGIGTSTVNQGSLLVTNGNVGIGTWTPNSLFAVGSNAFTVNNTGAITAVTGITTSGAYTQSGNGINAFTGNIGEGTTTPQGSLVVTNGNVGIGTWAPLDLFQIGKYVSSVSGFMVDSNGNVGIGTIITSKAAMSIMNGNVGIGTYIPPVLFAAGPGTPIHATAVDDSYFGHDVEVEGVLYATTVVGAQDLVGDLDIGGFYLTSKTGTGNGTVSISGGTGADQTDLAIATNHFVGIGTSTPASRLTVNGGESIGTSLSYLTTLAPANGLMVQGNVGIGSQSPGQALDVNGTIRTSNFTMSGQTPISGYVLTASDSSGDTTWSSPGTVGGWTVSGNNVYETSSGNVGIGTSSITQGSLLVTNGNVGIGTWAPTSLFAVGANAFTINNAGVITAVTGITTSGAYTQSGGGVNTLSGKTTFSAAGISASFVGNVGIGSVNPGQALDVQGTVRTTGFTMSGQTPISGYVLTASDSSGDTTWSSPGTVGGWTVSGNNVYETSSGNVGIGTSSVTQGSLLVTNGNVGIGTWTPTSLFAVGANAFTVNNAGVITAVTGITTTGAYTQSGNGINAFSGNVGIGTTTPQALLSVVGGNVGIGTWTAALRLDVNGTVRMTGFNLSTAPTSGYILTSDANGNGTWLINAGAASLWATQNVTDQSLAGGNVGIGTIKTTTAALTVMNGNVGIGTWVPAAPLTVGTNAFTVNSNGVITAVAGITTTGAYTQSGVGANTLSGTTTFSAAGISASFAGNVGIGSVNPGQRLDVQGTVRTTGFTMSGQTPISGYVLTASDSSGDTTWSSPGTVGGWTVSGNNVYETSSGNVGIGTSSVTQGSLLVTNGNVGIGTWTPTSLFAVGANAFTVNNAGVITAVTGITTTGAYTQSGGGVNTLSGTTTFSAAGISASFVGNVGIGSVNPGQKLDVQGTVRTTNFTMSGQTPISGYVLTASDSSGDTTWSSPGAVGGWTTSGNNVYETSSGNVGIGTSSVTQGSLLVTNGNVGIGTWTPTSLFAVGANAFTVNSTGAITAVTGITTSGAYTQNGNGINSFTGNIGVGTTTPQASLVVTNGNVGIGTWTAAGGNLIVNGGGNVGIGSAWPGTALDVNGTVRMTGFNITANAAATKVLTSDANGNGTWQPVTGSGTVNTGTIDQLAYYTANGTVVGSLPAITTDLTNIGIGTSGPSSLLDVNRKFNVLASGNVGIGSLTPGQLLDVRGTVRVTGFTMSGQTPISGYVLTASDSSGDTTWSSPGTVGGWTVSGNNVYETSSGNVGIGTSSVTQGSLLVTNGNVGIGTWTPNSLFAVGANAFTVNSTGAITAVTGITTTGAYTQSGNGINVFTGNVGIGSAAPGQALDVNGTVRMTGLTLNSNPGAGYVIVSNNIGVGTWMPASTLPGTGSANYWLNDSGNVGINTTYNIGIGTIAQVNTLNILGNVGIGTISYSNYLTTPAPSGGAIFEGKVGIGTWTPGGALIVQGGNVGIGTFAPSALFDVNGNSILGTATSSTDTITSSGTGTLAGGEAEHAGGNLGIITSSGFGSLSFGLTVGTGVSNGSIISNGSGSIALGVADQGTLESSGFGSIALGNAIGGTLQATANGSVAIGQNVQATAFNAFALGETVVNPTASSFMVGFSTTPTLTVTGTTVGVGIGTYTTASGGLDVLGNVGIGTFNPFGGGLIVLPATTGNVGIGSLTPGQALDVQGVVRTTGFTMSGQTPISGYVLTASDSSGDTTWTSPGAVGGWTVSGNNVYETSNGNVGIGTFNPFGGGLIVLPAITGNVGIGSLTPGQALDVNGTVRMTGLALTGNGAASGNVLVTNGVGVGTWMAAGTLPGTIGGLTTNFVTKASSATSLVNSLIFDNGTNVGIGSSSPNAALDVSGALAVEGAGASYYLTNVGIGSVSPGQALDVQGTVRTTGFTLTGNGASNGYVMVGNSIGVGTWMAAGTLTTSSQWTTTNVNDVYLPNNGNVGLGTSITSAGAALAIMNGNVGIGTWAPSGSLVVIGGNVGIGTNIPNAALAFAPGTTAASGINFGDLNTDLYRGAPGLLKTDVSSLVFTQTGPTIEGSGGQLIFQSLGGSTASSSIILQGHGNFTATSGDQVGVNDNSSFAPASGTATFENFESNPTVNQTGGANGVTRGIFVNPMLTSAVDFRAIEVATGNVGIGTISGNLGIGSQWPGQRLDVQGVVRTTGFTMSGQTPISGYVLTASDSSGDTTWSSPGTVGGWTTSGNNVYETSSGNVGIGTSTVNQGSLLVTNGNVGIGTWTPNSLFAVGSNAFTVNSTGAITAVTGITTTGSYTQIGASFNDFTGNVGIGSAAPGQKLDVQGTIRDLGEIVNGNVGIGTSALQTAFAVASGNVGIGTWTAANNLSVVGGVGIGSATYANTAAPLNGMIVSGNVGIGSLTPGQALDVNGTVRMTGLTLNSNPGAGYVIVGNSVGVGTWMPASTLPGTGGSNYWLNDSGNVGINTTYNIGIGTISQVNTLNILGNIGIGTFSYDPYMTKTAPNGGMIVSGNVGIGTWAPTSLFAVGANAFTINNAGVITAVTGITTSGAYTQSGGGANTLSGTTTFSAAGISASFTGNVGIGSVNPGQRLDVQGTVRTTGFTMSGQTPISGYVLTASDSSGDTTWSSPGTVGGWTTSGNNVYETSSGNVGIGTSTVNQGSLLVTNGNVGIGTWTPNSLFAVGSNAFTVNNTGAITAVTGITTTGSYTQIGASFNDFTGNVGIGSAAPGQKLDVQGTIRTLGEIVNGNVGIGTSALQTAFAVANGNVGIGTWTAANNLSVVGGVGIGSATYANTAAPLNGMIVSGNVGIGSLTPGQALDVNGTVRMTGLTLNSNPGAGYVIVGNSVGVGTWMPASTLPGTGGSNYWLNDTGNVGINTTYNIGIGTIAQVNTLNILGNIGIGTFSYDPYMTKTAPNGGMIISGNVGIGTWVPSASFTVNGSSILGISLSSTDSITSGSGTGSLAGGLANHSGGFIGSITSSGSGSLAFGQAEGLGIANGVIIANSNGAIAMGGAFGGTLESTNEGSIALGVANFGNLQSTGTASVAIGENVQATANNAFALGETVVNPTASSFMVGFSTIPALTVTTNTVGVGIGTYTTASGALDVLGGNVGIGTFNPFGGGLIVLPANTGNVGIGSLAPGQALDVQGVVRTTGFTMSGQTPISGYVLTASDSSGDTTWTSPGAVGGWTVSGNNVYETSNGNVGIGTFNPFGGGLIVLPAITGNVGIGSLTPGQALDVNGTVRMTGLALTGNGAASGNVLVTNGVGVGTWMAAGTLPGTIGGLTTNFVTKASSATSLVNSLIFDNGTNVGIGSSSPNAALDVSGALAVEGAGASYYLTNVGIGSVSPGQALDVQGTVRTTGFTLTGNGASNGYVMVGNSVGIGTWMPANTLPGTGGSNYWLNDSGNVGINTTYNIGIGTISQVNTLNILGNVGVGTISYSNYLTTAVPSGGAIFEGNVGIGTWAPTSTLSVMGSLSVRIITPGSYPYSAATNDQVILASASSGNVVVNLPAVAAAFGREYIIKKTDATGNTVTITANGSDTIDGQGMVAITSQYQSYTIVSDGTHWYIL